MLTPQCGSLVIAPARKDRVDNGRERPGSRGDCILHSRRHLGEYLAANEPVGFEFAKLCFQHVLGDAGDRAPSGHRSAKRPRRFRYRLFLGSCPIVRAVINMAVTGDMTTTAEGVETQEQREILQDLAARRCRETCTVRLSRARRQRSLPGSTEATRTPLGEEADKGSSRPRNASTSEHFGPAVLNGKRLNPRRGVCLCDPLGAVDVAALWPNSSSFSCFGARIQSVDRLSRLCRHQAP
jgi:hypothetical protein